MQVFCSTSIGELHEVDNLLIPSLNKQEGIDNILLTIVNYTGGKALYGKDFNVGKVAVREINASKQLGFGESHNFAFNTIDPKEYFLITNPGYLNKFCLRNLKSAFRKNIGLIEARQLPYEHPKEYDKETGETPWASGACVFINSKFFKEVNGFDENFWMYNEDVDLSWQAWLNGYKVIYENDAVFYHFSGGGFKYNSNRYHLEHFWSLRNFLYISYKYWGKNGERKARKLIDSKGNLHKELIEEVYDSYYEFKDKVNPKTLALKDDDGLTPHIKIFGLNQFHKINKNDKTK